MNKKVYLAGPINGCTDEECKDWREAAKQALGEGNCVDPMVRDYRGREDDCAQEIVELDKEDIDGCHALLINYVKPSVGTSMETLYAYERGKFIVVVRAPGTRMSPWLLYHAHQIFSTFEEAYAYLKGPLWLRRKPAFSNG